MSFKNLILESTPKDRPTFYQEITKRNIIVFKFFLPTIVLFEAFNIIYVLCFTKTGLGTLNNRIYFTLYFLLMLISIISFIALLIITKNKNYDGNTILNLSFIYIVFFCFWSTFITLLDLRDSENITVYVNAMLSTAVLLYLKPWQLLPLLMCNQVIFLTFFTTFQQVPTNNIGNYINSTIIVIVSIAVSISRYYNKCLDFNNRHTIMIQNEEITKINEKLNQLVCTDALSGLYNRRYLDDILCEKWNQKSRDNSFSAVIMLDIDNFKNYNDYYGHQMGDVCIQEISSIMKVLTKDSNNFAVRYGGEEFTVVMFHTNETEVLNLAENIRQGVYNLKMKNHNTSYKYVTISEGLCFGNTKNHNDLYDFIKIADYALYDSKKGGRNKITFTKI